MRMRDCYRTLVSMLSLACFFLAGCGSSALLPGFQPAAQQQKPAQPPEWFNVELTDAQTGEAFTMNDFAGKVVLVETMAMWCPTCLFQAHQVSEFHKLLESPNEVVSVSLDVDLHEDAGALKDYCDEYGFDWRFAISPVQVSRALGNLYSAQYLNPPLSPMLIIDRAGGVHQLDYGVKSAESLHASVRPYLAP
jgi:cytochrome oxidase Cu insertion factor (SCO1/SenC/PrrC family)